MEAKQSEKWTVLKDLIRKADLYDRDADGNIVFWKDSRGKSVSDAVLKGVLKAIFEHYPYMFPGLESLRKSSGIRVRTIQRAIAVLQAKDVLIVNQERTGEGYKRNVYTILEPKLRYLAQQERMPLFDSRPPRATSDEPRATSDEPRATSGALTSNEHAIEEENESTSDVGVEVDRVFSFDEEEEIKRLANELVNLGLRPDRCGGPEQVRFDRETILKTATLRVDGKISEQIWGNLVDALRNHRQYKYPVWKLFWGVMRNQCREIAHASFSCLLKNTAFPQSLLEPPAGRVTITTEGSMKGR